MSDIIIFSFVKKSIRRDILKKIIFKIRNATLSRLNRNFPTPIVKSAGSKLLLGKNVRMRKSYIYLGEGVRCEIGDGVELTNCRMYVLSGTVRIGNQSIIGNFNFETKIDVYDGALAIGMNSTLRGCSVMVRHGGNCNIGNYTAINNGTEIRCESFMSIGDFVMVLYECLLFDTNTHQILPPKIRQFQTQKDFPCVGLEHAPCRTSPVIIGDNVWIGQRVAILKGVKVGASAIIGLGSVVSNDIPSEFIAAGNPARIVKKVVWDVN
jgi:acetyltransferase-like isoleucine patch superfamily enzyme